jgi:hypothetical protein
MRVISGFMTSSFQKVNETYYLGLVLNISVPNEKTRQSPFIQAVFHGEINMIGKPGRQSGFYK